MNSDVQSDLEGWKETFRQELSKHLASLTKDPDIYGFALEFSEDLSELHFITCVGRESSLVGEQPGSMVWIDRRYSHVEWDGYLPPTDFQESLSQLQAMADKYHDLIVDDDNYEDTKLGAWFRETLYETALDAMRACDENNEFGNIWFKIVCFSDYEHPIVKKSFLALNKGRAVNEAKPLYD